MEPDTSANGGASSVTSGAQAVDAGGSDTVTGSVVGAGGGASSEANASGAAGAGTGTTTDTGGMATIGAGGSTSTTGVGGSTSTTDAGESAGTTAEGGSSTTSTAAGDGAGGSAGGTDTSGKIVLFDGTSFDEWRPLSGDGEVPWELPGDGTMVVVPETGNIVTRQTFEDLFVHVEYKTPMLAVSVTGQDRGNSGVYLNSMYELQVLDSFGLPPAIDGCGAIYQVSAPSSTACYEQEMWNTYEIEFQIARFDSQGQKLSDARVVSAYLNGVLVQQDVDVPDSTKSGEPEAPGPGPLMLQDHLNRVAFRNIWVIPR